MLNCIPCRTTRKINRNANPQLQTPIPQLKPKLQYKPGKTFYEDRNKKVFSALCTSRSASGVGVIVKQIRITEPITNEKINICNKLVKAINDVSEIDHPHLIRYLEASYNIETQFFEIITEQLPITFDEDYVNDEYHTKMCILDILDTIEFLEEKGYSYLNLKASNVLFDHNGAIKLRDFVGNHLIERLINSNESLNNKNEIKSDTEVDIKSFMNIIRNIGVYKIKFSNASNYNRFIFYLENLHRWNFTRLRNDKFFQEVKQSELPANISFKGFIRKKTITKHSDENPLFLTSEKRKEVYKGDPKKKLEHERLLKEREDERESILFLKNLQRLQAFQKAKIVGSRRSNSSIIKSEISKENIQMDNQKAENIKRLMDIQKQLEEGFGNSIEDSMKSMISEQKPKGEIHFRHEDDNNGLIINQTHKEGNLDELRRRMKMLEDNFDTWGAKPDNSIDHMCITEEKKSVYNVETPRDISQISRDESSNVIALHNKPLSVYNLDIEQMNTSQITYSYVKKSTQDDLSPIQQRVKYVKTAHTSFDNKKSLKQLEKHNLNNFNDIEYFEDKSQSNVDEKLSIKETIDKNIEYKATALNSSNLNLFKSRVQTEETRGTTNDNKYSSRSPEKMRVGSDKLNISQSSDNIENSQDIGWVSKRKMYDAMEDLQKRRKKDVMLRQSLNF